VKSASRLQAVLFAALLVVTSRADAAAVNNVRVWSGPESTRVVFELSAPVEHRAFTLTGPDRLVIDLPNTTAAAPLGLPDAKGVVASLRAGPRDNGELRVVLELTRAAKSQTFLLAPNGQYGHRLVVDLFRSGVEPATRPVVQSNAAPAAASATVAAPSAVPVAAAAPATPRAPAASGRDVVIAIDAGHGGEDPGASGRNGGREKDVVLAIARKLAAEVDAQPGMRAVLVRSGDYFVPHRKRMEIAHRAQADFFISIHADAYRDSSAKGATVYVLSEKGASDEAASLLAQRENASDLIGGVSLADTDQLLARVLLDLSQNAALSASTAAGQRLIKRMSGVAAMRKLQVQQARFLVLKSPDIPSVLVETGYISNPREEASLRSQQHQAALAKALREGIVDYFAANPPQGSYFATRSPAAPRETVRHVIARGETLSGIAERYRVSTSPLRRSNSLKSDSIRIGQVLTIPPG
jgi:N-acetylmuramoyl-L-alanine amidase